MVSLAPLFHLFGMDEQGYTPAMRRMRGLGRVIAVAYPVLGVVMLFFLFDTMWFAWRYDSGSWSTFWQTLYPAITLCLLPLRVLSGIDSLPGAALRGDFQAMRRAAIAGDDELAPLVTHSPASLVLPTDFADANSVVIRHIRRLFPTRQRAALWAGALLAPAGLGMVALGVLIIQATGISAFMPIGASAGSLGSFQTLDTLVLSAVAGALMLLSAGMAVIGAILLWQAARFSADLAVAADEQGVRWRRTPWRRTLTRQPWSAARAFYSISYKGGRIWSERRVYALDFGVYILAWEIAVVSNRYISARALAREQAIREASARLCAAITRYTALQERDVTALARQIVQAKGQLIEDGRAAAQARYDDEAIAALELSDPWRLPDTPIDPLLSPLDISFGSPPTTVARKTPRPIMTSPNATQNIRFARALLPYTGPTAQNSDIPGLADPIEPKSLSRLTYVLTGVSFAILALVAGFAAWAQFL